MSIHQSKHISKPQRKRDNEYSRQTLNQLTQDICNLVHSSIRTVFSTLLSKTNWWDFFYFHWNSILLSSKMTDTYIFLDMQQTFPAILNSSSFPSAIRPFKCRHSFSLPLCLVKSLVYNTCKSQYQFLASPLIQSFNSCTSRTHSHINISVLLGQDQVVPSAAPRHSPERATTAPTV